MPGHLYLAPIAWVEGRVYDEQFARARDLCEHELILTRVLRRLATITPRPGHWVRGWQLLQTEAKAALLGA